jgi:hypothetical protein
MYIAADDAKGASACVYTPASLDQTYVAATPNAWRILGLRVENGAQVERPILAGGEVSDPNRISAGGFRLAPGERVILEVTSTCKRTGLTTVTIPGTGLGVNPDEECASAGSLSAGS